MTTDWGMGKARKRVLKQTRSISDEEIIQFLSHDGTPLSAFYLEERYGYTAICMWHPQNGSMEMHIDDGAMGLAAIQFLGRQGIPYIASRAELEQLARLNNWTNFKYR
jgi:hypothetical protein